MTKVYIADATTITALGEGLDTLYQGLVNGKSGLTDMSGCPRFDTSGYQSSWAGLIPDLAQRQLSDQVSNQGPNQKRRPQNPILNDPGSLIFALADRLLENLGPIDPNTCLITASTKAGIDLLPVFTKNPMAMPNGLLVSSIPGYISQRLGLTRPGFNISAACASSTIALAKGAAMIKAGREEAVLVCAMDVVSEFVFSGFSAIGAMSPDPAAPFDINRKGLTLGEGAAGVLLMNEEKLSAIQKTRNIPHPAQITGWGVANDACHLTAPAKDGAGLKMAITAACQKAKISYQDICAVNTHGTGTQYNDEMEIRVLNDFFDPSILANSIKGAIGHTLGAGGAIEAALCLKLLEKQILPGTRGFTNPSPRAQQMISSHARPFEKGPILTTNSGFGGINAALIIQEADL